MGVLTSDKWGLTPERIKELEGHGVTMVHLDPLKGLNLPAVVYGEHVVGEVTHDEAVLFRALWDLKGKVEKTDRAMQAEVMYGMADAVAEHNGVDSTVTVDHHELTECLGPGERELYWKNRQTVGYLHALFHYTVGERLGMHHVALGLRAGGQIVRMEYR